MSQLPQSIALHIGAHKTASSHLQKVLHKNRNMLLDEGIRYFGPGYLRMPGRSLSSMFGLSWSDDPAPGRNAHEQLAFLVKGKSRLVFSEENFVGVLTDKAGRMNLPLYPAAVERVAELIAAWAPIKCRLFVAVRNPATFMASAYSQALFGAAYIGPRTYRARNDWRHVDWVAYVQQLRAIKGISEIYVWRQEDYERAQTLIMRRLLRWQVGPKVASIEGRVHQGLSAPAVRQTLEWAQEGLTEKLAVKSRSLYPINADNKPFALYAPSTLADAQSVYDAQMAQIDDLDGVTVLHPPKGRQKG